MSRAVQTPTMLGRRPIREGATIASEGDGVCVWVHLNAECIGRFGKFSYEIYGHGTPREMIAFGRTASAADWLAFRGKIHEVHRHDIGNMDAPTRLHDGLDMTSPVVEGQEIYLIPLCEIDRNPFEDDFWGRGRVTREDVRLCLERRDFVSEFIEMDDRASETHLWDARRIAYFVENPDSGPIEIEVVSTCGVYDVGDGHHRLAAAIYRGDESIPVALSGYIRGYDKAFPSLLATGQLILDEEDEEDDGPSTAALRMG